jgi:uncharacterized protein (UPF0264 family)
MTRMLASVSNVQEAISLLSTGVDILDIKDPRQGALGAVEIRSVIKIVNAVSGRVPTSATIGDLPMQTGLIDKGLTAMRETGVNIVKVGIFAAEITQPVLDVFCRHAQAGARIVLVFFADLKPGLDDFAHLAATGINGVMLDTSDKSGGSLRSIMPDGVLQSFVNKSRAQGLMSGLAGSLQVNDIQPLLELEPDFLGFRSALCSQGRRQAEIDLHAARRVRSLIPAHINSGLSHLWGARNLATISSPREREKAGVG